MANFSMIVGGCVSYGVSFIEGGFAVWRIFYLVIGLLTISSGVIICIFLPDSPVRAKRFSEAEKVAVLLRIKDNQSGTQNAKIKKPQVVEALQDGRILLVAFGTLLIAIPAGGLSTCKWMSWTYCALLNSFALLFQRTGIELDPSLIEIWFADKS